MNEDEKDTFKLLKGIYQAGFNGRILGRDNIIDIVNIIEKQQKEIGKLKRNMELIINEIVNKANTYDYQNKITAGINKSTEIAYVTLVDLLEEINKKLGE